MIADSKFMANLGNGETENQFADKGGAVGSGLYRSILSERPTWVSVVAMAAAALCSDAVAQTNFVYQPGFHQALRWSVTTSSETTYRMKIPIGRAGSSLRISFRAGDGPLTLHSATIAPATFNGITTVPPIPIVFAGDAGFTASARERVTSDPLPLSVIFNEELYLSFDVDGALATSAIMGFPDSYWWSGSYANVMSPPAGTPWPRATGVDTIDVLAPPQRVFVALGDSITEGYVDGDVLVYTGRSDNYRNAWTTVAQRILEVPIANTAVSGQGVLDDMPFLSSEVFTLEGVSDCITLIGTNDLAAYTAEQLEPQLQAFVDALHPFCRVWGGTLLPKEKTSRGDLGTVNARRQQVNTWIRSSASNMAGVVDFEAAVAQPDNVNNFRPGLTSDGVHPSIDGDAILGQYVADQFSPPHLSTIFPVRGSMVGGTLIVITGDHLRAGARVLVGGAEATVVAVDGGDSISAMTPAGAIGSQVVTVANTDGQMAIDDGGFTYTLADNPSDWGNCDGGDPDGGEADGGIVSAPRHLGSCSASGDAAVGSLAALATFVLHWRNRGRRR